ncbi:hypothetical protein ACLKA6_006713 [Drosophila palustris]
MEVEDGSCFHLKLVTATMTDKFILSGSRIFSLWPCQADGANMPLGHLLAIYGIYAADCRAVDCTPNRVNDLRNVRKRGVA